MRTERDPSDWTEARIKLFALYNRLHLRSDEQRHHLQQAVIGCASLRLMTDQEHQTLINVLEIILAQPKEEQAPMLERLLTNEHDTLCQAYTPPLSLEATVKLIDIENETFTNSGYPVTLAVRQGIELLLPNLDGGLEPRVFLEYHQGQVRLQVWDDQLDQHGDEPITLILKTISTPEQKETVPF